MTICQIAKCKFFKIMLAALFLLSVAGNTAGDDCQQHLAQDSAKSCLWTVQSGSNTVYLLGSLHVLKSESYPLAAVIEDAYTESKRVVFETDLEALADPAFKQKMLALGLYPEGQTLSESLDGDTLALLKNKMQGLGLPVEQFDRFKPWFLAVSLSSMELARLGFNPNYGIDLHFFSRAKEDEKKLDYLEPVEYQLDLLGKMGEKDQIAFLNQTLRELDIAAELAADMTAYWQDGDAEKLYTILNASFEKHPDLRTRLLIKRNQRWVSQIEKLMKQNESVLVIVGAGHLVGPESVVDLLRQKKYQVKQK